MRSFCVLLIAVVACNRQLSPAAPAPASTASCGPPPSASVSPAANTTSLRTEAVDSPIANLQVGFVTPDLGGTIDLATLDTYLVQVAPRGDAQDALGIDVALDAERPRRLPWGQTQARLKDLAAVGAELSPGAHWLFAAPVSKSGTVPRATPTDQRAATARRFFIGPAPSDPEGPSGAVWLRKPEGTYNGAVSADRVLFDAYAFSATGALLDAPCTIALQSSSMRGDLRLQAPFYALGLASGEYEVTVSAQSALPVTSHFTVNRELGGGP